MQINGSGALVAGGASGLGAATVRRLHADGAHVVIADLNEERGSSVATELGERASFVRVDVTGAGSGAGGNRARCRAAWRNAHLDLLRRRRMGREGRIQARSTLARSVRGGDQGQPIGTFNVLRLAAAAMLASEPAPSGERGVCVNTASIAAFDGQIDQISSSASKGGIVGMTLPAARDLASGGIRVCTIAPGTFDTPLLAALPEETKAALGAAVPFPSRLGRPEEFAALAAHIVENEMLNGEVIRLDGALRMPLR